MSYLTYTDEDTGVLVFVEFDSTESAAPSHSATATEHPVSDAAVALNDFLYVQSPVIKLDAWITETPLYESMVTPQGSITVSRVSFVPSSYEAEYKWTEQATPPQVRQLVPVPGAGRADNRMADFRRGTNTTKGQKVVVTGATRAESGQRTRVVYNELVRIQNDAVLVDLYTKLGTYEGCWLTEITAPSSAAGAIKFSLTFTKTRFGSVLLTDDVGRRRVKEKRAKQEEYLGAQTGYSEFDTGGIKTSIAQRGRRAL